MDLNSFFVDKIDREAIKVVPMPTIKTAFLTMALRQKLPRPFYKSNVNNTVQLNSNLTLVSDYSRLFTVLFRVTDQCLRAALVVSRILLGRDAYM